ncbi:YidC/Oxa1 family membrane protein insertase [Nocardioides albertanoniae]|uniref:Membrane protein insertase YidC n=1 Tax=Nocardioides albertanoniae TaxID=1175486 RepID=A0A543A162_9ACTN|nr:membrane protein insertase YidC [Nocardioides albertanoniae]TQL66331.1 YidC/Oxa1 family membrane protein insertase [Nocardioides albertanoniae]
MGAIGDLFGWIATPLYYAISGVLLVWQKAFSYVIPSEGWQWALAIVGLTVTIRALLIPLFVKQINSSRNMQLLQPKVKELQKKYGHDREKLANETMKLYKDSGTNPFASCLPLLLQMPIFFVLFRMLSHASKGDGKGFLTDADAHEFANSTWLGSLLSDQFTTADHVSTQILTGFLVVAMIATTFLTQRQLMSKNMPADAMTGQYAQQQKLLLYVLPVVFAIGGIAFPVGTILYWTSSNLWTMGQQFYVIRNNPAPGTPAFDAKKEREKAKRQKKGLPEEDADAVVETKAVAADKRPAQRQQPKNQSKSQRKKAGSSAGRSTTQKNGGTK